MPSTASTAGRATPESRERLIRRSLKLSKALCFGAATITLLAAAGWIWNIEFLTRFRRPLPAMQPNTAIGLFLCIIAVLLTPENRRSERGRLVACVIGVVV